MHIESPTRREIWLAVFLLISLLFFSRSRTNFDVAPSTRTSGPNDNFSPSQNSSDVEQEITPQPFRDRLKWGAGEIPQTKIVAHVPGTLLYVFFGAFYKTKKLALSQKDGRSLTSCIFAMVLCIWFPMNLPKFLTVPS